MFSEAPPVALEDDPIYDLVETIVYAMVDHEEDVRFHVVRGEHNIVIEVKLNEADIGKVIGGLGKNAEAIRTILNAACKKLNVKYTFDIITSKSGGYQARRT